MSSTTERLRFSNAIYVAPSRPLVEVAKQVATASVISGGRVSLAVGAGWMLEPHPPAPVPILCGGESDVALRRAARLCDGWVGTAYGWDDAVRYVQKLTALRHEYGRGAEPFAIMLALLEMPSPILTDGPRTSASPR
ncbi:LLM class flavin-dependent oxidoreductase [Mycobacterium sp.]|uniref:LLM class flavin-dependent oxidoreductase n=1 Tax=Mycobacterium sp. TaxID=1785 RepID=UPI003D0F6E0F